jgi:carboxyl-terminal processing protease
VNYDNPRWYEEKPDNQQASSPNQPVPPGQPGQASQPGMSGYDEFEHYPFLPAPDQEAMPDQHNGGTLAVDDKPSRIQRIIGQVLLLAALVVIAFWGGWFSHEFFGNSVNQSSQAKQYEQLVQEAWSKIDQNYVSRNNIDYKKMAYSAINAMVDTLGDPGHSRFMDPETVQKENEQLSGKFTGIGIYLHQDKDTKELVITSPIPGSPAEKAGFKPNDVIVAIDGTNMKDKTIDDASKLIQGKEGTSVTLTIRRPGETQTREIKVTRAEIKVPNVMMHYDAESHIAYIQVVQFADGVSNQLRDQLSQAKTKGATKIILDLRDNPGGYLNEAVNMASLFLKDGSTVLLQQDSSGKQTPIKVNGNPVDTTSPIVVLVNENSASAAEIVSGALQENGRATIIGKKTFGTGTVLEQFTLSDGSALYLGTQEWLTPKGHFIRQDPNKPGSGGITPDIVKDMPANSTKLTPNDANQSNLTEQQILQSSDAQLIEAINYLKAH